MTATAQQPDPDDELVQTNVRIPRGLRNAVDARRAVKGLSRDKWVANALRYALSAADRAPTTAPGRRTAPPPNRR